MIDLSPKRATKRKKRSKMKLEGAIEREILTWLYAKQIFCWKVKSVGTYDPTKRSFRSTPWYYRKGVWDIHFLFKGRPGIIEVKSETGELSALQKQFGHDFFMNCNNPIMMVVRSVEEVEANLKRFSNAQTAISFEEMKAMIS